MSITKFFDWFIPELCKQDFDLYRRAYMLLGVSWYGIPFFLVNIVKWQRLGSPILAINLTIVMFVVWGAAFVLRYTESIWLASNLMLAALNWHFIFLPYRTGGLDSDSLSWTLIVPLFALMLVKPKNALFWITVTGVVLVSYGVLKVTGHQFPTLPLESLGTVQEQLTNALGPFLGTFILGLILKRGLQQAVQEQHKGLDAQKKAQDFEQLFRQVQRSGTQVTSSATELAATTREHETAINQQVEATRKVLGEVKQISEVVADLVQTMQQISIMSQEATFMATKSQADLARMEAAIHRMEGASETISNRLAAIDEKTRNITTVVTTITKVADQTNLLSLNAAIEAEKAGEFGRGFTVVAREIRRLADQTAVATLDIEQMVKAMQTAVGAGVTEMDQFIEEVRHNAEDIEKISLQLTLIITQVQALSPRFEAVNVAMGQQSAHALQINADVLHLSQEMAQTKESLEQTYAAISQLNDAARNLQYEVSRFHTSEAT